MAALTTEQTARKLKRAKISLMRSPKFALWSGIMMIGKTELVNNIPTACTDGINEFYGEDFVRELPDKQLAFVVLHENLHKGMRHLTIWRKLYDENAKLANMACDYVINGIAVKCDPTGEVIELPMRDGKCIALIDSRFDCMNTKTVAGSIRMIGRVRRRQPLSRSRSSSARSTTHYVKVSTNTASSMAKAQVTWDERSETYYHPRLIGVNYSETL
jgi:hypothetical protein